MSSILVDAPTVLRGDIASRQSTRGSINVIETAAAWLLVPLVKIDRIEATAREESGEHGAAAITANSS